MTLRLCVLDGRTLRTYSADHPLIEKHSAVLDALCTHAGLRPLSDFFDFTDLHHSFAHTGIEATEVDPETGGPYSIDDMTWFDAAEGLRVLGGVREHVAAGAIRGPLTELGALVDELKACARVLEGPALRRIKFHLALMDTAPADLPT